VSSYALSFKLPYDPSRPVLSALSRACAANWSVFLAIVMEVSSAGSESAQKLHEAVVVDRMQDALQYLQNACELLRWIRPNTPALSVAATLQMADLLRKSGCSENEAHAALKKIGRKSVGRPGTKRQMAIRAKEMKLADPKRWTWPKVTAALCGCGRSHDIRCQDNLRREIQHLDKVLKKFGCALGTS